jgi:hypothetical protein
MDDKIAAGWKKLDEKLICILPMMVIALFIMFNVQQYSSTPRDVDSFYYMNPKSYDETVMSGSLSGSMLPFIVDMMGVEGSREMLIFITFFTTCMIYLLSYRISRSNIISSICTTLFFLDPIHVMQYVNVLDKPPLIMFAWVSMIWIVFTVRNPVNIFLLTSSCLTFIFVAWQGYFMFSPLFIILLWCMLNDSMTLKGMTLYICSSIIMMALIETYYDGSAYIVQELRPAWNFFSPVYIVYVVVIMYAVYWLMMKKKDSVLSVLVKAARYATDKMYVSPGTVMKLAVIIALFSISSFRLMIFFVPVAYIGLALMLKEAIDNRRWFSSLGILSGIMIVIMLSVPAYSQYPVKTQSMEDAVKFLDDTSNSSCLMTDWGTGHIYQYFTDKTVLDRGHPDMDYLKRWVSMDWQGCDVILTDDDVDKMKRYRAMLNITKTSDEWQSYTFALFNDSRLSVYTGWRSDIR